jgi:hypothetical protein
MLPPYSHMGDRIQAMNDCADDIDDGEDKDVQCCDDETDNLSDWQYLTATFDNDQMFADDTDITDASKRELDRLNNNHAGIPENKQAAVTLKRSRSNPSIFDGLNEAQSRNHGLATNPTENTEWLRARQFDQYNPSRTLSSKKSSASAPFNQSEGEQADSIELRIKSWSHPQLRSQALPQSLLGRHPDFAPNINFLHQSKESSDFPSPSLSLSERLEKYPLLTGQLDINELNHFRQHHEPLEAAQLPYTTMSKTYKKQANPSEYTRSQSAVQNHNVDVPGRYVQMERVASTTKHYCYPNDDVPHPDNRFKSMHTTVSQQTMPSASRMLSTTTEGYESATAYHTTAVMRHNATLPNPNYHIGSVRDASTQGNFPAPSISQSQEPLDTTMIEQQMRIWMKMIGTPTLIPPYQQLGNKKLLLHPLTPYNYYYRDERDNIVAQISNESDPLPPSVSDFKVTKMQALLHQHWFVDPVKKKRKHRKSHGKMNFQRLSKAIAQRWHELPVHGRDFYRLVARYDDLYYHQQLDSIKERSEKVVNTHL